MYIKATIHNIERNGLFLKFDNKNDFGFISKFNLKTSLNQDFPNRIKVGTKLNVRSLNTKSPDNKFLLYTQSRKYNIGEEVILKYVRKTEKFVIFESKENISYKLSLSQFGNSLFHGNKIYKFFVKGENIVRPQFLWKQYDEGSKVSLKYHSHDKDNMYYCLPNGNKTTIRKTLWEKAPKFKPPKYGEEIQFRLIQYNVNMEPDFELVSEINPYFITIDDLLDSNTYKNNHFSLGNRNSDDLSEIESKMYQDYKDGNANWIFSYSRYLWDIYGKFIHRLDFDNANEILKLICQVEHYVLHSGFLLTYSERKRKASAEYAENALRRCNIRSQVLDLILNNKIDRFLVTLIKNLKKFETDTKVDLIDNCRIFSVLSNYIDYLLSNVDYETIINLMLEKEILFDSMRIGAIYSRKKRIRKNILKYSYDTKSGLENSKELRHLIFLLTIELEYLKIKNDRPEIALVLATVYIFKSYYDKLEKNKINFLEKAEQTLEENLPLNQYFSRKLDQIKWSYSKNIELGEIYEYRAIISDNHDELLSNLNSAIGFYSRAKEKKSWYLGYFYNYFSTIILLKDENKINQFISEINELKDSLERDVVNWDNLFPSLNSLLDICKTLCYIGCKDIHSMNYLFNRSIKDSSINVDLPNRKELAGLVLANNLLELISKGSHSVKDLIYEYINKGILELKQNISHFGIEKDQVNILDHEIFTDEVDNLEYKGSYSIHIKKYCDNNIFESSILIKNSFLKAVAGMLNGTGGKIYLGILETDKFFKLRKNIKQLTNIGAIIIQNRIIIGIEPELELLKKNADEFTRYISQILRNRIKKDVMTFIKFKFDKIEGRKVIRYEIKPHTSEFGVLVNYDNGNEKFWVRENNEVNELSREAWARWYANRKNILSVIS